MGKRWLGRLGRADGARWLLLLLLPIAGVHAQEPVADTESKIEVVSIRSRAMAEADPPLRYSLLTPFSRLKSGNAAIFYYRALLLLPREKESRFSDTQQAWLDLPLSDLPQDSVQQWLTQYEGPLYELKQAAVRDTCQWGLQLRELDGLEAIMFRLPELQEARELARVLRLKRAWRSPAGNSRMHWARCNWATRWPVTSASRRH